MRPEDFDLLYQLEEKFWWFTAMRRITERIAGGNIATASRVLDAGCGTGWNLKHLHSLGANRVFGIDVAEGAILGLRRRGFTQSCQASVTELPFADRTFDMVFSFDVMCQVPPDSASAGFGEMARVLKPGGHLFVRVPAFEWLRSSHDEELHTYHRYTRAELESIIAAMGFEISLATYLNAYLFPIVVVRRLLKHVGIGGGTDVRPLPGWLAWANPVLGYILQCETGWIGRGQTFPFGSSVVVYARKSG